MNRWPLIRIAGCFILVFALGGMTGWLLKPSTETARQLPSAETVLANFDQRLDLSEDQEKQLASILAEWESEAQLIRGRPRMRLELMEKYAALIREILTPPQQATFDKSFREAHTRLEERLRQMPPRRAVGP